MPQFSGFHFLKWCHLMYIQIWQHFCTRFHWSASVGRGRAEIFRNSKSAPGGCHEAWCWPTEEQHNNLYHFSHLHIYRDVSCQIKYSNRTICGFFSKLRPFVDHGTFFAPFCKEYYMFHILASTFWPESILHFMERENCRWRDLGQILKLVAAAQLVVWISSYVCVPPYLLAPSSNSSYHCLS